MLLSIKNLSQLLGLNRNPYKREEKREKHDKAIVHNS